MIIKVERGKDMRDILAVFPGYLKTVDELNEAVAELTGDEEPCFDDSNDEWKELVEYKNGKTYILGEEFEDTMEGKCIRSFYTGGTEYQVREVEDSTYGYVYKIYSVSDFEEPELIYTIYRQDAVDVFIQNIMDANIEYDLNL